MTILIVDDDPAIRQVLAQVFADEGYTSVTAAHGQEAVTYLQSAAPLPRLILLDMMMPVMNGAQFWQVLKANADWSGIPVMMLSTGVHIQQVASALTMVAMIPKPIDFVRLLALAKPYCTPRN